MTSCSAHSSLEETFLFLFVSGECDVPFQSHCNQLDVLLLMCFSVCFFSFHHKHRMPSIPHDDGQGEGDIADLLEICCDAHRVNTSEYFVLYRSYYCQVIYCGWMKCIHSCLCLSLVTSWILDVGCWLRNIISMFGQSFVTSWILDVGCWLLIYMNIKLHFGHD